MLSAKPVGRFGPIRLLLLSMGIATAFGLAACGGGGGDSAQVSTPVVTVTANNNVIVISVLDAKTGGLVPNAKLTFSGTGASSLVDGLGAAVTSVSAPSGLATVYLKSGVTPTAAAPVVFSFAVTASGYLGGSDTATITATGGSATSVSLVKATTDINGNLTSVPAGVAGQIKTFTATTAGTLPAVAVAVPTSASTPAATVTIPAGTGASSTVNGVVTPAAAGPLTVSVVTGSPSASTALATYPGSFTVTSGGTTQSSITLGFASFSITDSAGNPINTFTTPVTLSLEIPSPNPVTGAVVAVNDPYPIQSFNATTGAWQVEAAANGHVTAVSGGKATVQFQTLHLSDWSVAANLPLCQNVTFDSSNLSAPANGNAVSVSITATGISVGADFGTNFSGSFLRTSMNLPQTYKLGLSAMAGGVEIANGFATVDSTCRVPALTLTGKTAPGSGTVTVSGSLRPCATGGSTDAVFTAILSGVGAKNGTNLVTFTNVPAGSVSAQISQNYGGSLSGSVLSGTLTSGGTLALTAGTIGQQCQGATGLVFN